MDNANKAVPADLSTMSLDAILDSSVDNLLDMREFKPLPVGRYKMLFGWEASEDPIGIRFILQISEILELADPSQEEEVELGYKWLQLNAWFNRDGEPSDFGQGRVKAFCQMVQPVFGGQGIKEVLDNATGAELIVQTLQRRDRKDREVIYDGIKSMELYDPEVHG